MTNLHESCVPDCSDSLASAAHPGALQALLVLAMLLKQYKSMRPVSGYYNSTCWGFLVLYSPISLWSKEDGEGWENTAAEVLIILRANEQVLRWRLSVHVLSLIHLSWICYQECVLIGTFLVRKLPKWCNLHHTHCFMLFFSSVKEKFPKKNPKTWSIFTSKNTKDFCLCYKIQQNCISWKVNHALLNSEKWCFWSVSSTWWSTRFNLI